MTKKVAMIPMICPLYRLFVWEKMNAIKELDFVFYFEETNQVDNIKYIPKSILDKTFNWKRIKNRYYKGACLWQSGVLKCAFGKHDAIIMSGNVRCLSTWVTGSLARLFGKKVYFWSHGIYGKEKAIDLIIKKIFFSIPNQNFVYEQHALDQILKMSFDKDKNHVIYNSLNYDYHKSVRADLEETDIYSEHFKNNNPVLLFIGRLTPQKKLYQFIEALKLLENEGTQVNAIFIGSGTEKEKLKTQALNLNLSPWFFGECYEEEELANLIYNADICISPGNVGLTLIHCLSYGTPVITHSNLAYQMPEAGAIKAGYNGDLFELDSVSDLKVKISEWLLYKKISREEIRENCYKIIDEKYNPYFQADLIRKSLRKDLHF